MCLLFSFLPTTAFLALGYLVLVNSNKAEAAAHTLGRVLAIWIFVVALLFPLCGAYVTFSGICPLEQMLQAS